MHTIHEAAAAIRAGSLTPVDLVEACHARIDALEPAVRAWVFVDRDGARAEARRLTDELKHAPPRGPLHGIPVGVKDIFDVFDWPTAAGSKHWANAVARQDSTAVARLRRSGAIFLGKTVTTAYASFDPPVTRNPWDHSKTPGGSSSGSAAAVACGMCLGALASQTGGSITRPASYCGVVGLKPTFGHVPLDGVVPLAPSLDHAGVIAWNVRDAELMLRAMADAGLPLAPDVLPDVGRLGGFFDDRADPVIREAIDRLCDTLQKAGFPVNEYGTPSEFADVVPRHRTVMAVEAAAFHERRFRARPDDYPPHVSSLIEEGLATPAPEYARCRDHQRSFIESLMPLFYGAALLTPATTGPAPDAATTGDPAFNSPWSYAGFPTVSLPVAWTAEGLPLCVQLVGQPGGDADLLALAAGVEAAVGFERRIVGS